MNKSYRETLTKMTDSRSVRTNSSRYGRFTTSRKYSFSGSKVMFLCWTISLLLTDQSDFKDPAKSLWLWADLSRPRT